MTKRFPTAKQLKKELESKKLEQMYLFLGEEVGEKDKIIQTILQRVFDSDDDRRVNSGRYHIENGELFNAVDFALGQSMFSEKKVVIMYNIDKAVKTKAETLLLKDLFLNVPQGTVLVFTSIQNKVPAVLPKEQLATVKVVQFWKYFDSDIFTYLKSTFTQKGYTIDEKTISFIIERTGKDIKKLDDTIEIISNMVAKGSIGINDIQSIVDDVKEVNIFEYIDKLFKKESSAIHLVDKLLKEGTPELSVVGRIIWQLETIEKYYAARIGGISHNEAIAKSGVFERNKNNFLQYLQNFSFTDVKQIYTLLANTDMQIKSTKIASDNPLANPVVNLTQKVIQL